VRPTAPRRGRRPRRRGLRRGRDGRARRGAFPRAARPRRPPAARAGEVRSRHRNNHSVDRVGRYRLGPVLGEGATGVVYRAEGEDVAVKVLRGGDPVAERRFAREARLARAAASRHLVPVLEVGERFIVMPYYRGGTLADRIRAEGRLALVETVDLAAQLAQGLDALHACGIVHRDVKPSNVLLEGNGVAALADFG